MPNKDIPYYQDKDFLALQQQWYSKLNDSGFKDIEKTFSNGNISRFVKLSCRIDPKRHPYIIDSTYSYYSLSTEFLHAHEFASPQDKEVWELYSEGWSYRQIQKATTLNLQKIFKTVKKYEKLMFEYEEKMRNQNEPDVEMASNETELVVQKSYEYDDYLEDIVTELLNK